MCTIGVAWAEKATSAQCLSGSVPFDEAQGSKAEGSKCEPEERLERLQAISQRESQEPPASTCLCCPISEFAVPASAVPKLWLVSPL